MFPIEDNYRGDTIQHLFAKPVTIRTAGIVDDSVRLAAPRGLRCPPLVRDAIFGDRLCMHHHAFVGRLDHGVPRRLKGGHLGERFISRSHGVTCLFNLLIIAQICIGRGRQTRGAGGKGDESCQKAHRRFKACLVEHREIHNKKAVGPHLKRLAGAHHGARSRAAPRKPGEARTNKNPGTQAGV